MGAEAVASAPAAGMRGGQPAAGVAGSWSGIVSSAVRGEA